MIRKQNGTSAVIVKERKATWNELAQAVKDRETSINQMTVLLIEKDKQIHFINEHNTNNLNLLNAVRKNRVFDAELYENENRNLRKSRAWWIVATLIMIVWLIVLAS